MSKGFDFSNANQTGTPSQTENKQHCNKTNPKIHSKGGGKVMPLKEMEMGCPLLLIRFLSDLIMRKCCGWEVCLSHPDIFISQTPKGCWNEFCVMKLNNVYMRVNLSRWKRHMFGKVTSFCRTEKESKSQLNHGALELHSKMLLNLFMLVFLPCGFL